MAAVIITRGYYYRILHHRIGFKQETLHHCLCGWYGVRYTQPVGCLLLLGLIYKKAQVGLEEVPLWIHNCLFMVSLLLLWPYYSLLCLSGIGDYRNGSHQSIWISVLVHSSMMAVWIFFILGTMIRYHWLLTRVK